MCEGRDGENKGQAGSCLNSPALALYGQEEWEAGGRQLRSQTKEFVKPESLAVLLGPRSLSFSAQYALRGSPPRKSLE